MPTTALSPQWIDRSRLGYSVYTSAGKSRKPNSINNAVGAEGGAGVRARRWNRIHISADANAAEGIMGRAVCVCVYAPCWPVGPR